MKRTLILAVAALMVLLVCACDESTELKPWYTQDELTEMESQWGLESKDWDIAFLGDSRVAGGDWQEAFDDTGLQCINIGIGGDVIEGCIARYGELSRAKVEYCILAIGVNNCHAKKGYTPEYFKAKYDELLTLLEKTGVEIVVCTNPGFEGESFSSFSPRINETEDIIKELALKHGMKCIDVAAAMNDASGNLKAEYSSDGVHYTTDGFKAWYDSLRPTIEEIASTYKEAK